MKESLDDQIKEIENSPLQEVRVGFNASFELKAEAWLTEDLSGNYGALYVRAILNRLNVNESHVLNWRLENKYKQYTVLTYYCPGCIPETLGLSRFCKNNKIEQVHDLFEKGFFLKAALGDGSLSTNSWDRTNELEQIIEQPELGTSHYEKYILQKKLNIKYEFRIHSFGRQIIPCLTYIVKGDKVGTYKAECFLDQVLKSLPEQILSGTLIAWDIALTKEGDYFIIEGNFTGYHPEYRKGFQTTGYVDNHLYGPIICAWLNLYLRKHFGIYVDSVEDGTLSSHPFFQSLIFYISIFKIKHFDFIQEKAKGKPLTLIVYLGDDTNFLMVDLVKHFLLVDFADRLLIIIKDDFISEAYHFFESNSYVQFCSESWLFTSEQFEVIKLMSYERKRCICCYHALRRNGNYKIL